MIVSQKIKIDHINGVIVSMSNYDQFTSVVLLSQKIRINYPTHLTGVVVSTSDLSKI